MAMEGVPRIPMLSFPMKRSADTPKFRPRLRAFISDHYNENPDSYSGEITELESLRASATHVSKDYTGCATLKKYFCQLNFLKSRFPLHEGSPISLAFSWYDVYSDQVHGWSDIDFEMSCVLFNIGALHSELGTIEKRQTSDGIKSACTHFQCAAWAFQHLRHNYQKFFTPDVSPDILSIMINVCLGQAQECILEKSLIDNRKSTIQAKVVLYIVEYYQLSLKTSDQLLKHSNQYSEKTIRAVKTWKKLIELKVAYYSALAHLFRGLQAEDEEKWGERITFYKAAAEKLEAAFKLAKNMEKTDPVQETLVFTNDVIIGKLKVSEKENEFIYHDRVPELNAVIGDLKGVSLVKGVPVNVDDPEVSGPDIFGRLVPMEAHEASSMYSEEKAKLLRTYTSKIEDKNKALEKFLLAVQLNQLDLHTNEMRIPQELVDCCAALSANKDAVKKLSDMMSALSGLFHDVDGNLNEIHNILQEQETKEKEYQSIMGKRPPNNLLTELSREEHKHQNAHKRADESNQHLHEVMKKHLTNIQILMKPFDDVLKHIPSAADIGVKDDNAILEMQKLASKVEEMQKQREMLEMQLRESIQKDDITKQLVVKQEEDQSNIFEEELKKHEKITQLIDQNLIAQENIIRALTEANSNYAETRKATGEIIHRRNNVIQGLIASYEAYDELIVKCNSGIDFYKKLDENVLKLLQRVRSVAKVQDEEREQVMTNFMRKLPNQPPNMPSMYSNVPSADPHGQQPPGNHPKLKDFYTAPAMRNPADQSSAMGYPNPGTSVPSMTGVDPYNQAPLAGTGRPKLKDFYQTPSMKQYPTQPSPLPATSAYLNTLPSAPASQPPSTGQPALPNAYQTPNPYGAPYQTPTSIPASNYSQPQSTAPSSSMTSYNQQQIPPHSAGTDTRYAEYYRTATVPQPMYAGQTYPNVSEGHLPAHSAQQQQNQTYASAGQAPATYNSMQPSAPPVAPVQPTPLPTPSMSAITGYTGYPQQQNPAGVYNQATYYQLAKPSTTAGSLPTNVPSSVPSSYPSTQYTNAYNPNQQTSGTDQSKANPSYQMPAYSSAGGNHSSLPPITDQIIPNRYAKSLGMTSQPQPQQYVYGQNSTSTGQHQQQQQYQQFYQNQNIGQQVQPTAATPAQQQSQPNAAVSSGSNPLQQAHQHPYAQQQQYYQAQVPGQQYAANQNYYSQAQPAAQPPNTPASVAPQPQPSNKPPTNFDLLSDLDLSAGSHSIQPLAPASVQPASNSTPHSAAASTAPRPETNQMESKSEPEDAKSKPKVSVAEDFSGKILPIKLTKNVKKTKVDPLSDPTALSKFAIEVEKLSNLIESFEKKSLNGPTNLDLKWREVVDIQNAETMKKSISVARCYPMKNRFPDILPFDQNSVRLPSTKDDYINASFIKELSSSSITFIATQAPLPSTYEDFWHMIWSENVELIVCLVGDIDLKGHTYWPDIKGKETVFGPFRILLQTRNVKQYYVERIVSITHCETKQMRVVIHLQFLEWVGNVFPGSLSHLLSFVNEVHSFHEQQRNLSRPVVIHCLPGVGKTGVFCLLSSAIQDINDGKGILDLTGCAGAASKQRKGIMIDKEYLKFSYHCLLYYCQDLLLKRGILSARLSFDDKKPKKNMHTRHPSQDFLQDQLKVTKSEMTAGPETGLAVESKDGTKLESPRRNMDSQSDTSCNSSQVSSRRSSYSSAHSPTPARKSKLCSDMPANLTNLDPTTFHVKDKKSNCDIKALAREAFESGKGALLEGTVKDPTDPLSSLDPLWSIKK